MPQRRKSRRSRPRLRNPERRSYTDTLIGKVATQISVDRNTTYPQTSSAARGEAVYRRCSDHHHHHLVCRTCGRTVEVEGPAVERWAERVAAENGFSEISHTVEVFGTCARCTS